MRERSFGNSTAAMAKKLWELHSEEWLRKTSRYLAACKAFKAIAPHHTFEPPPPMQLVPNPKWLMVVYMQDVNERQQETLAKITSVTGRILKMDSTKKVHINFTKLK